MPPGMIESPDRLIDAVLLHDLVVELPCGAPAHSDARHDEVGAGNHGATVGRANDADRAAGAASGHHLLGQIGGDVQVLGVDVEPDEGGRGLAGHGLEHALGLHDLAFDVGIREHGVEPLVVGRVRIHDVRAREVVHLVPVHGDAPALRVLLDQRDPVRPRERLLVLRVAVDERGRDRKPAGQAELVAQRSGDRGRVAVSLVEDREEAGLVLVPRAGLEQRIEVLERDGCVVAGEAGELFRQLIPRAAGGRVVVDDADEMARGAAARAGW